MKKYLKTLTKPKVILCLVLALGLIFGAIFYYLEKNQVMPQASIFFLDQVKLPQNGQRLLVFSPHPDDETIAAGGYIAMAEKNGAKVEIVLVTDGNKHGLRDKRYAEFKKSTGILGVPETDLVFLGFPDGKLMKQNQDQIESKLRDEMDKFNPDIILYPNPKDGHPDHSDVGRLVNDIIKIEKRQNTYQYLVHHSVFPQPKKYRPYLYLLPPLDLVNFDDEWQKLDLPQNIEDQKTKAIYSYESQLKVPILRSLILSSIRKNELFSIGN